MKSLLLVAWLFEVAFYGLAYIEGLGINDY
jgi:hypothetical protein